MALDAAYIQTNSKQNAAYLIGVSKNARQLLSDINILAQQMSHLNNGTDFSQISQQFGMVNSSGASLDGATSPTSTQAGSSANTIITNIQTLLQNSDFQKLCYQVQQF